MDVMMWLWRISFNLLTKFKIEWLVMIEIWTVDFCNERFAELRSVKIRNCELISLQKFLWKFKLCNMKFGQFVSLKLAEVL